MGRAEVPRVRGERDTGHSVSEKSDSESTRQEALDVADVLFRRFEVVESLIEQSKDKRELVEDIDVSRSTVDRATRELETAGLVEYVGGDFVVTSLGEFSVAEFVRLIEMLRLRRELDSFLQWVPQSEFKFDTGDVMNADIVLPEPGNPYNMVNKHVRALNEAETVRAVLPLTGLHAFEVAHDAVVDDGADYEFVVVPDVVKTYESNPNYVPLYEEMVESGHFDLYIYDGDVPYYLGLLDGTVQIGVDEDGEPRALLETDAREMQEWAQNEYESYKQWAERIT